MGIGRINKAKKIFNKRKLQRTAAVAVLLVLGFRQQALAAPTFTMKNETAGPVTFSQNEIILDESSVKGTPDRLLVEDVTYRTTDPGADPAVGFSPQVYLGTEEYRIESISEPVIAEKVLAPRSGGTYVSEPFTGDGTDHLPEKMQEFNGVQMELVSSRLIDTVTEERTEETSVSYEYEGLEAGAVIPRTQDIEFTDNDTGHTFTAPLKLGSSETISRYWAEDFTFPVHIEHADADVFDLGDAEIPKEDPLIDHAADFLRLLSLDPGSYEITSIEWVGEPYADENGVLCRDARAKGKKLLRDVSAVYEGTVTYPSVAAKAWECEYREIVPEEQSVIYTMSVDVTLVRKALSFVEEEPSGLRGLIRAVYEALKAAAGKVVELIREHPAESVVCLIVTAAFIVFLLFTKANQPCIYQPKLKCPYRKYSKEKCETCVHKYQTQRPKMAAIRPKDRNEKANENTAKEQVIRTKW